ncbi:MAG: RraA family protein [Alphaproteobacteria bacterium]
MTDATIDAARLDALAAYDTPTICNALEIARPERRGFGFTVRTLIAPFPTMKPMVGFARTATIRTGQQATRPPAEVRKQRMAYYRYVGEGAAPKVSLIQDLDDTPGLGSFWGEVNSAIHKACGCVGVVTNGAIRDLDAIAPGFNMLSGTVVPSHIWAHLVDYACDVNIAGMVASHDDLIHADRHGAVIVPPDAVDAVLAAADLVTRKEAPILACARGSAFTLDALEAAFGEADDVH